MSDLSFRTQEEALDFLDSYAEARKTEIDRRELGKGYGLIKSYMLETAAAGPDMTSEQDNVEKVLSGTGWRVTRIGQNGFYRADQAGSSLGFVEVLSARHLALHTIRESATMDKVVTDAVNGSSLLDFVWLAGTYLNLLWELLIREQMPRRFVKFKFEHEARFEDSVWNGQEDDDFDSDEDEEDIERLERRASTLLVANYVRKIKRFLPLLQRAFADFKAIKMLRFPASEMRGGYDFWDSGKVTYRSPSFRDGRACLRSIIDLYQRATELIEERVWYQVERTQLPEGAASITLTGAPVSFVFPEPLALPTFENFVETTFEKSQGPFRLWGNPLQMSEKKVHVYGIDLHLWQRIYLELTPTRFVVVLPHGTCGNTIHRLVCNIQRYLSPNVKTYIGEYPYEDLVRDILLGKASSK